MESLSNRMDQREDRILELKDKVEELEHSNKNKDKVIRKYEWYFQDVCNTMKRQNLRTMAIEEFHLKSIQSIFNKIMAENFPKLGTQKITSSHYTIVKTPSIHS